MFGLFRKEVNTTLASDIRLVTFYWLDGGHQEHMVSSQDLGRFLQASKNLHISPGVNPHNQGKAKVIGAITVQSLEHEGSYWLSAPNLQKNDDEDAATIWDWSEEQVRYQKQDFDIAAAQIARINAGMKSVPS